MGAKLHSSSSAVKVVSGIMPIRFRKSDLCSRDYVLIITLDNGCELRNLLEFSSHVELQFWP